MNFKKLLSQMLQGASNGAAQALESSNGSVNWASVGIVAAFGALAGLTQALQGHPAVVAAQTPKA